MKFRPKVAEIGRFPNSPGKKFLGSKNEKNLQKISLRSKNMRFLKRYFRGLKMPWGREIAILRFFWPNFDSTGRNIEKKKFYNFVGLFLIFFYATCENFMKNGFSFHPLQKIFFFLKNSKNFIFTKKLFSGSKFPNFSWQTQIC